MTSRPARLPGMGQGRRDGHGESMRRKTMIMLDRLASKWLDYRIEQKGFNTMLDNGRLPAQALENLRAGGVERLRLQDRVSELRGRLLRYERIYSGK